MTRDLVIVGCGGFGREVWSIVSALPAVNEPWDVEGFVDDDPGNKSQGLVGNLGSKLLGSVEELASRRSPFAAVLAIGAPAIRAKVHLRLAKAPVLYPILIHPDTTIGHSVEIGDGVVICPGARLSTNIKVGSQVQVDQNATIGHDSTIGEFARLSPQACISGAVSIGKHVFVGASATILPGLIIGDAAIIGAGACVIADVAPGTTVMGVPAR